ncbi:VanZ family protein [Clostridium sp. ZS2-4]|uniref:VanZ family protein n=1 Tax=Clostridium sp. ZS2-4 TaxID=2987703 RepID=UPI00227CB141|nr:VanZ family protein [Clostridium sp. ZS2-4]MCY6355830.1 VanZ family protein [Clostridium sp. ZS2-4]
MKQTKKLYYFKGLLLIIWMAIIFNFSNDPAVVSDEKSGFILKIFDFIGLDLNSIFGTLANFIVRKMGHFTEFFILYVLLYNVLKESFSKKRALTMALACTFLYACSDEFHQIFIPGREGRFRDVLIDTSGGIAGVLYFSR